MRTKLERVGDMLFDIYQKRNALTFIYTSERMRLKVS